MENSHSWIFCIPGLLLPVFSPHFTPRSSVVWSAPIPSFPFILHKVLTFSFCYYFLCLFNSFSSPLHISPPAHLHTNPPVFIRPLLSVSSFPLHSSPSSSPSSFTAVSPCCSRISYFQSQIAVAGMPNSTTDTRGSTLVGCHLTSNIKGRNRHRLWCRQERRIQYKQDIRLIFLLLYLLPCLLYSRRPGAGAGWCFNCVVEWDEKGIWVERVCFSVCVCPFEKQQQQKQIIGEAHLDTSHPSTRPSALQTSTAHPMCKQYVSVSVCVVNSHCPSSQGLHLWRGNSRQLCVYPSLLVWATVCAIYCCWVSIFSVCVCVCEGGESSRSFSWAIKDSGLTDDPGQLKSSHFFFGRLFVFLT